MTARGMRLCNPGNLEKAQHAVWGGEVWPSSDERFCQFESLIWSCRAIIKTLVTYHEKHHLSTIRQMISRWAPDTENNTTAYMKHVGSALQKDVDERIDFDADPSYYLAMAKVIARHECGIDAMEISDDEWEEAFKMAGF